MKHTSDFTFENALSFIHGAQKLGSKLGLSNIRELMRRLGHPEEKLRIIHVAGTNGKGTTTMVLASILKAAGYRTGAYTSPFVYHFNERIMVDGVPVSDAEIAAHTKTVKTICDEMTMDGMAHPTEFEIITAIAFLIFVAAKCEFVVLEVGLGGRLDATNVIEKPLLSIITTIGYDHMEYLGESLSEITAEKCGIIKEGVPVVSAYEQKEEAYQTILSCCAEKNAKLHVAEKAEILESQPDGIRFHAGKYRNLFLPLAGAHMAQNAASALSTVEVLREKGILIPEEAIREGVAATVHRGRFETISKNPLFIVDGAHNMDGIHALLQTAEATLSGKRIVLLMGMLADKEYEKVLMEIGNLGEKLITVTVPSPRAASAATLAMAAKPYYRGRVTAAPSLDEGVLEAIQTGADVVLAFGSLYMLGDIYNAVKKAEANGICG